MKLKLILLLINLGLATSIFSQSLLYLYDAAGNRITRMQVATRSFVLQKNEVNVVSSEGLLERKAIKLDRKSTRLNSSHTDSYRMPSSA